MRSLWFGLSLFAALSFGERVAVGQSVGPSFDCQRASNALELLICAASELARLDRGLDAAYRDLRRRLDPESQQTLQIEQRRWLQERASRCALKGSEMPDPPSRGEAMKCLSILYQERTAKLSDRAESKPRYSQAVVEQDDREGYYADPRITIARIQSNLERVARGVSPWPPPDGVAVTPAESIVDAYAAFLRRDFSRMDKIRTAFGIDI